MFWHCSLLIGSVSSLVCNQSVVVLSIWAMPGPSSGCFVKTKSVCQHKIVKGGKLQKSEYSVIVSSLPEGPQMPCQFSHASLPTFAGLLAQQECPSVSDQWHSVAGHRIFLFHFHRSLTFGRMLVLP